MYQTCLISIDWVNCGPTCQTFSNSLAHLLFTCYCIAFPRETTSMIYSVKVSTILHSNLQQVKHIRIHRTLTLLCFWYFMLYSTCWPSVHLHYSLLFIIVLYNLRVNFGTVRFNAYRTCQVDRQDLKTCVKYCCNIHIFVENSCDTCTSSSIEETSLQNSFSKTSVGTSWINGKKRQSELR